MPRRLELSIQGERGKISFGTFATAIRNSFDILSNLDSAISAQPHGSLDWFVIGVEFGSLVVAIESRPKNEDMDVAPRVVESFVDGLQQIREERTTPPYFSDYDLRKAQTLARSLGKDGAQAIIIRDLDRQVHATIEPDITADLSRLINVSYKEAGSVEGKLEMVSIHGAARFTVYHAITRHSIRCRFATQQFLDKVKEALGRRVIVSGNVHFNFKHEPIRVELDDIRILPQEEELPLPGEIRGIAPDFTGNMITEDYVRSLRE